MPAANRGRIRYRWVVSGIQVFLEKLSSDVFSARLHNEILEVFVHVLRVMSYNCYYPGTVPGQDWTRELLGAGLCRVNNQIRRTGVPACTRIQ